MSDEAKIQESKKPLIDRLSDEGEIELGELSREDMEEVFGPRCAAKHHEFIAKLAKCAGTRRPNRRGTTCMYNIVVVPKWGKGLRGYGRHYDQKRREISVMKIADGGPWSTDDVAEELCVSIPTVHNWRKAKRILAWKDEAGRFFFPSWQFYSNRILPGIQECLVVLGDSDDIAKLRFFLTAVDGVRPLDLLRKGRKTEAVEMANNTAIGREGFMSETDGELTIFGTPF